jgi:hypothetical protein
MNRDAIKRLKRRFYHSNPPQKSSLGQKGKENSLDSNSAECATCLEKKKGSTSLFKRREGTIT